MNITPHLPGFLRAHVRRVYHGLRTTPHEPMMYRVHLFSELLAHTGQDAFRDRRVLEIGPRDGLDSKRLAKMHPAELVMIDLPEKRELSDVWLEQITCPKRYIEANLLYLDPGEYSALGRFALIWCTGVLYHNAEQLRFLRRLHCLLEPGGWLVLESATLRGPRHLREGNFVQLHWPQTYRNTGTATHLPTAGAIRAWLNMVGFSDVTASRCFETENRNLAKIRMACFARRSPADDAAAYYAGSGRNPVYRFGDAT